MTFHDATRHGTLVGIFVAPKVEGQAEARTEAELRAGEGLVGDRHHEPGAATTRKRALTLIAEETLADLARKGLPLAPGASRRQLVVRGVDLAALEGRQFKVGEVLAEGTGPCHPCDHLEQMTQPGVKAALENRGGLTARVLTSGRIRVGDRVEAVVVEAVGGAGAAEA